MKSLELRLQVGIVLSLILLMGLVWLIGNQSLRGLTEDFVVSRLEHDAEGLVAALVWVDHDPELREPRINPIFNQPFSGHYYVIRFSDDRELTSRSLWGQTLVISPVATGEVVRLHLHGPEDQSLLVLVRGFEKQGQYFTLAVAEDLTPIEKHKDRFKEFYALLILLGLSALLLVQILMLRRAFRRLDTVREEVGQLKQGSREMLSENVPKEILPLVLEINQLYRLFTQRLQRSRHALGNLAHALKQPLTLLVQYLDNEKYTINDAQRQRAVKQAQRIQQLMEGELLRARLAGRGGSSNKFDSSKELPDLVALLKQLHYKKDLEISYCVADSVLPFGDREDMLELIGNLMENACKWAKKKVFCTVSENGSVFIVIEDDGSGLSDKEINQLSQRGSRLDEGVEGHGLGLAIVADIIELYSGEIRFGKALKSQGLRVEVIFPRH
jgi:signal transduction histidine kinase